MFSKRNERNRNRAVMRRRADPVGISRGVKLERCSVLALPVLRSSFISHLHTRQQIHDNKRTSFPLLFFLYIYYIYISSSCFALQFAICNLLQANLLENAVIIFFKVVFLFDTIRGQC